MNGYKVYTREVEPLSPEQSVTLGELLQEGVDERFFDIDIEKWRYMKGAKRIERTRADGSIQVFSEGAIPFPDILDRPGRTMLTSEGSANRSSHLIQDPSNGRFRTLTPVECERLNGFDDGWTEGMSERQRYFTMGNALVVQLIEVMGRRLDSIDNPSQ